MKKNLKIFVWEGTRLYIETLPNGIEIIRYSGDIDRIRILDLSNNEGTQEIRLVPLDSIKP